MANHFTLLLDNPTTTFHSGEEIIGKVIFSCSSNCKAKGIRIKLEGKESTVSGTGNHRLYGRLILIAEEIYLVGDGQSELTIHAGHYEYPFTFVLPKDLGSSFASANGTVAYEIEASVVKPWHSFNEKSKVVLEVEATVDLKDHPDVEMPSQMSNSKNVSCLFCPGGSITGTIKTRLTGFTPGEKIQFDADIQNESFRDVKKLKVTLVQEISYRVITIYGERPLVVKNDIVVMERDGVSARDSDVWSGDVICVPDIPPSSVGRHIVDFQYFLRMKVCVAGTPWNLYMKLPLTIGTAKKPTTPDASGNKHLLH